MPVSPPRRRIAARANRSSRHRPAAVTNEVLPQVVRRLRAAYRVSQAPIVTLIAETTREPYRVLASCILSLRTQDATTAKAAERLFAIAPDVGALAAADPDVIAKAIYPVGFYRTKAPRLVEMARRIVEEFGGRVPDDIDTLLTFKGVGRKTANLVVGAGYEKPAICVDTHVHRISNRLGYVKTKTPDKTEMALREKLPPRYWLQYNDLLVSFGQTVCKPTSPLCSTCTLREWCPRIGVTQSR
ncbi:MAG TPA: endonuclease III [Candidatus Limnocylindrales bacterium]|nr:endonuclease III [Candidatus Limnocylindrales bacterium]